MAESDDAALQIVPFAEAHRAPVIALWRDCNLVVPWNDPDRDIDRKLAEPGGAFLVVLDGGGAVIGSAMVGYDGHRGAVNYLAVRPDCQGRGVGQLLMSRIEAILLAHGCPKINVMVRRSNTPVVGFYERLHYKQDDVVVLGKRLIADE